MGLLHRSPVARLDYQAPPPPRFSVAPRSLNLKSSQNAGCMRRSPASHCCHVRNDACTNSPASVCVSPAFNLASVISFGAGLADGLLRPLLGWLGMAGRSTAANWNGTIRQNPRRFQRRGHLGAALIFIRQEECRYASVGFGDDPERIFAKSLAGLRRVDWIGREDTRTILHGCVIGGRVVPGNFTPITAGMPREALCQMLFRTGVQCAGRTDDIAKVEKPVGYDDYGFHCTSPAPGEQPRRTVLMRMTIRSMSVLSKRNRGNVIAFEQPSAAMITAVHNGSIVSNPSCPPPVFLAARRVSAGPLPPITEVRNPPRKAHRLPRFGHWNTCVSFRSRSIKSLAPAVILGSGSSMRAALNAASKLSALITRHAKDDGLVPSWSFAQLGKEGENPSVASSPVPLLRQRKPSPVSAPSGLRVRAALSCGVRL